MRWTRGRRWVAGFAAGLGLVAAGLMVTEGRLGLLPSTRRMWREARAKGQPWWLFFHTYVYGRFSYAYIGTAIGERGLLARVKRALSPLALRVANGRGWANEYHGKVLPTAAARRLVEVREDVAEVVPEQIIPFQSARDLVLSASGPVVAFDCPCRSARAEPCLPMDVCLVVGDPFASFALEHHPGRAREISRQEAVEILEAEADRGHVHHAFFKHAMLDRLYAICNCCSCCCGAMWAQRNGTPMLVSSGYVAQVDAQGCVGCRLCAERCPFDAVTVAGLAHIDAERCMGCGVCVRACPHGALALVRDASKPAPLIVGGDGAPTEGLAGELQEAPMGRRSG
jgi:ferredoxin